MSCLASFLPVSSTGLISVGVGGWGVPLTECPALGPQSSSGSPTSGPGSSRSRGARGGPAAPPAGRVPTSRAWRWLRLREGSPLSIRYPFQRPTWGPEGGPQGLGRGRHQGWGVPQSPGDPAGTLTFRLAAPASLHLGTWLLPAPEPHAGPGKVLLGSSPPCPPTPRPSPPPTHTRGCVGPSGPSPGPLSGDVLLFTGKETEAGGLHQWLQTSASEQTTPPPRPGKGSDLGKRPL